MTFKSVSQWQQRSDGSVGGARIITTVNTAGVNHAHGSRRDWRGPSDRTITSPSHATATEAWDPRHCNASYFRRHFLCLACVLHIRLREMGCAYAPTYQLWIMTSCGHDQGKRRRFSGGIAVFYKLGAQIDVSPLRGTAAITNSVFIQLLGTPV